MFILQDEMRWTWPVTVKVPAAGGVFEEKRFTAGFRLVPEAEWEALGADVDGVVAQLRAAVTSVEGVAVQRGQNSPDMLTPDELKDALLAVPFIRTALMRAYVESLTGTPPAAAVGN